MTTSRARLGASILASSTLVAAGALIPAAALGAPHAHQLHAGRLHAGRSAAPAKSKIISSALDQVTLVPHSTEAWAIGSESTKKTYDSYVARRKNGRWSKVAVKGSSDGLSVIAAASAKSIWAIGTASSGSASLFHSTGGTFKIVKGGISGAENVEQIVASSASNVWAIGTASTGAPYIAKLKGHKFKAVKIPTTGISPSRIATSGPTNTWFYGTNPTTGKQVAARWNGHKLSVLALPAPEGTYYAYVATTSAKRVWVVGSSSKITKNTTETRIAALTLAGKSWKKLTVPRPYPQMTASGIAAAGTHVYLAGAGSKPSKKPGLTQFAFALTLKGHKWKNDKVGKRGVTSSFNSVAASSRTAIAVGASYNGRLCGDDANVRSTAMADVLSGSSWALVGAPQFRVGGRTVADYTPDVPGC